MRLKFVDREEELAFLNKRYDDGNLELFVIYGRRIGRTELIKKFWRKNHTYAFSAIRAEPEGTCIISKEKLQNTSTNR